MRGPATAGEAGLDYGKHAECYHTGDNNRRVIQGMVELRGWVAILGAGAGRVRVRDRIMV
jgi:hypothetical protein